MSSKEDVDSTLLFKQHDKVYRLYISFKPPGKGLTLFLFSKIFILLFLEHLSYTTKNKHSCS